MYNNTEFIAMKLLSKADLRRMVHEIYIEIKIDILKNRKLGLKIYWVVLIQTYFFFHNVYILPVSNGYCNRTATVISMPNNFLGLGNYKGYCNCNQKTSSSKSQQVELKDAI